MVGSPGPLGWSVGTGNTHSWQWLSWLKMHFWSVSRVRRLRGCSTSNSTGPPPAATAAAPHLACGEGLGWDQGQGINWGVGQGWERGKSWGEGIVQECGDERGVELGFGGSFGFGVWDSTEFGCRTGLRMQQWVEDRILGVGGTQVRIWGAALMIWGVGGDSCPSGISHEQHTGALVEDSQVIPEHIPMEGGCQESPVPCPALPIAQQQPLSWGGDTGVH